ncbi:MAG: hypothetical protein R3A47_10890 [Polyangiales bacterium]
MKNASILMISALMLLSSAVGCGAAIQHAQRTENGGVVVIPSDYVGAIGRKAADKKMAEACGGPFRVVEENQVFAGQETTIGHDDVMDETSVNTAAKYEVQIRYECVR